MIIEHKSIRAIAKALGHGHDTVAEALTAARDPAVPRSSLSVPRAAPKLGEHKARIEQLAAENATRSRQQRHTAHKI